ncbi:rve domain-containing protein [Gossypium australe]|uniref:Rve domain-containing protein n=1 Tax=Gossypium australe TaxID=47621 RepID=A0A5B6W7X0_9ROSI|nr:rve domain-containing protein [Gossypium australe]
MCEKNFLIVYDAKVDIPVKISLTSHRMQHFNKEANQKALRLNLDLVDELKETTEIKNIVYAQQVARYYNSKFQVGDLVLRNSKASLPAFLCRKMAPS